MFLETLAKDSDYFESFKIFYRALHANHGNCDLTGHFLVAYSFKDAETEIIFKCIRY